MRQKTNQILYSYWNEVRGERVAPRRFEIEPSRIASILPETLILERLDSETFSYRLAGTKICEQFGSEFRGTNFLDGWDAADQTAITRHLETTCSQGGVLVMHVTAGERLDRSSPAAFEMTLMPLLHTTTRVTRFLGAVSAIDPPAWLGSRRLAYRRLSALEVVWPDGRPHQDQAKDNQAPLLASLAGARLVKIDRRSFRVLDGGRGKVLDDKR
jgi:hypothetical protein